MSDAQVLSSCYCHNHSAEVDAKLDLSKMSSLLSVMKPAATAHTQVTVSVKVLLEGEIMKPTKAVVVKDIITMTPTILTRVTDPEKHLPCVVIYVELALTGEALEKHINNETRYWVQLKTSWRQLNGGNLANGVAKTTTSFITDKLGKYSSMFTLCYESDLRELKGPDVDVEYEVVVVSLDPDEELAAKDLTIEQVASLK